MTISTLITIDRVLTFLLDISSIQRNICLYKSQLIFSPARNYSLTCSISISTLHSLSNLLYLGRIPDFYLTLFFLFTLSDSFSSFTQHVLGLHFLF